MGMREYGTAYRLVRDLTAAGASEELVYRAFTGEFDECWSKSATPITDLVRALRHEQLDALVVAAKNGVYDSKDWEWREAGGVMGPDWLAEMQAERRLEPSE